MNIILSIVISNLKIDLGEYQKIFIRAKQRFIKNLKERYEAHVCNEEYTLAYGVELEISRYYEERNRTHLKNSKLFKVIQNERPTRALCSLAKKKKKMVSIKILKDQNGRPFISENARNNYIKNFYQDLYKKQNSVGTIDNFLNDVINDPRLNSRKLNDIEKNRLDRPINISELDEAIRNCNINSAGGIDGISYKILRKVWGSVDHLILNAFLQDVQYGELRGTMSNVGVKLIPKKDDGTKITNWRPISLFSVSYKVISSAVTNRLFSVINKITTRSQCGFSRNRNLHMNICNMIQGINKVKMGGGRLS